MNIIDNASSSSWESLRLIAFSYYDVRLLEYDTKIVITTFLDELKY